MAIKDTSRKPYIEDNDTNIFIGLDLPIRKSEGKDGFFASTSTTIEAVKNNIKNLLSTDQGERLMQPKLGINLKRHLFDQITDETIFTIQNQIVDTFKFWLPFVIINDIQIKTSDNDRTIDTNTLSVNIIFSIKQDPDTLDSVQVTITNAGEITDTNSNVSGY